MNKLLLLICAGSIIMFAISNQISKDYARAHIIYINSAAAVQKIHNVLKNTEPCAYRLTVRTLSAGKTTTTVYGRAKIRGIEKLTGNNCRSSRGYEASIVLVIQRRSHKKARELRNKIVSAMDKQISPHLVTLKLSATGSFDSIR